MGSQSLRRLGVGGRVEPGHDGAAESVPIFCMISRDSEKHLDKSRKRHYNGQ
jgi:hypothetical protein